jgi:hypothetical protein
MLQHHESRRTFRYAYGFILVFVFVLPRIASTYDAAADSGSFVIFKYQHIVGKETDQCKREAARIQCHAHFQLNFTGSSISLEADIQTGSSLQPILYSAKGQNSTRSFVNLNVTIERRTATICENGVTRTVSLPRNFFTLQQDVPFITQELLFAYWHEHHKPRSINLLPTGEVKIRLRGMTTLHGQSGENLTRYSVHGVTWGDETVWLNDRDEIALARTPRKTASKSFGHSINLR